MHNYYNGYFNYCCPLTQDENNDWFLKAALDRRYPAIDEPIYEEMHTSFTVPPNWASEKEQHRLKQQRNKHLLARKAEEEHVQEMLADFEARTQTC